MFSSASPVRGSEPLPLKSWDISEQEPRRGNRFGI